MHSITIARTLNLGANGSIEPGRYFASDIDAAKIMLLAGGGEVFAENEDSTHALPANGPRPGERILILRPGQYGDLVLLTPCLREIKRRWPECVLCVACGVQYKSVIAGLPYIDEVLEYPVRMEQAPKWIITLETMTRFADREKERHMTDLFAERLGLTGDFDKRPDYNLSQFEKAHAMLKYPRTKKGRIGIQFRASDLLRTYPGPQLTAVIKKLLGRGWEIMLLGAPDEIQVPTNAPEGLFNCTLDKLSFRESCAVLSTCDAFLGPDSALVHIAGAIGVPAVGLYGPFPWELRTKYAPTTFALQGQGACAPCHCHPTHFDAFPAGQPCAKAGVCVVLAGIDPDRIIGKLEQVAKRSLHAANQGQTE